MNDENTIEKIITNHQLPTFSSKLLHKIKIITIKNKFFIGPQECKIKGTFYENLPPLKLEKDQAFAQSFTHVGSVLTSNIQNYLNHYHLTKKNGIWEINQSFESYHIIKGEILPINGVAREKFNYKTKKLSSW